MTCFKAEYKRMQNSTKNTNKSSHRSKSTLIIKDEIHRQIKSLSQLEELRRQDPDTAQEIERCISEILN